MSRAPIASRGTLWVIRGFATLFLVVASARAQGLPLILAEQPVLPDYVDPTLVADLNGDGFTDIWSGRAWIANAEGGFDPLPIDPAIPVGSSYTFALGDLDGDGDVDLFAETEVFLNDGMAGFSKLYGAIPPLYPCYIDPYHPYAHLTPKVPALGDFDGDGDLDCLCGTTAHDGATQNPMRYLRNDGTGRFTAISGPLPFIETNTFLRAVGDFDGDGDVDALFGSVLFQNNGAGYFFVTSIPGVPASASQFVVADFQGDGYLDLAFRSTTLLIVLGSPAGTLPPASFAADFFAMHAVDVDGDGGDELLLLSSSGVSVRDVSASGAVSGPIQEFVFDAIGSYYDAHVNVDLDRDGAADVLLRGYYENLVLLNDGQGNLSEIRRRGLNGVMSYSGSAGDFDGDGDVDVVGLRPFAGGGFTLVVMRNDGAGRFDADEQSAIVLGIVGPACVLDANGDGFDDLFIGSDGTGTSPQYLLEGGPTGWGAVTQLPAVLGVARTHPVDIDLDGDLDILLGRLGAFPFSGMPDLLLENMGGGVFAPAVQVGTTSTATYDIDTGDVDGDGDIDIVISDLAGLSANLVRVLLNDGTGAFSIAATYATFTPHEVTLLDFDGDGDLDGAFGSETYENDGTGQFFPFGMLPDNRELKVAIDADDDGDPDLVSSRGQILLNDGAGHFASGETPFTTAQASIPPILTDLDRDGDNDLVIGGRPYFSSRRDVYHRGLPMVGRAFRIVARPQDSAYWVVVSSEAAEIPMTHGVFFLDPTFAVVIDSGTTMSPDDEIEVAVALPAEPAIAGLHLHVQVVTSNGWQFRFTNRDTFTILP